MASAVALIPLVYLLVQTNDYGWGPWWEQITTERMLGFAITSLQMTAVVTAACLVIGVGIAFLVTRTDLPFRRVIAVVAALPLAVPSYVAATSWLMLPNLWTQGERLSGFWMAALVLTLYTYPYVYLPVAAALVGADRSQEEVARSLGRGPVRTMLTVTLRQVRPAIAGGGLLAAFYVLSDFGAVSILQVRTLTQSIYTAFRGGFNYASAISLSTVLVILTVVILMVEVRSRRAGARYHRTGGRAHTAAGLGPMRWPLFAAVAAVLVAALGVPFATLSRWFIEGVSRPGSVGEVVSAATGSVSVSLAGAAVTVALALPLGVLVARRPGVITSILERSTYVAYALPGIVVGLSLVFFGMNVARPFYQTTWMLALAYATLFLPLAVAAVSGAAAQSPPVLEDVGKSLGRRPSYVFSRVTMRLTLPGIGAGAALVFLTCMKELPATMMLRPTGLDTLATGLWAHTTGGRYAAAAPYGVLLILLAAIPTWLLATRSGIVAAGSSSAGDSPRGTFLAAHEPAGDEDEPGPPDAMAGPVSAITSEGLR